MRRCIHAGIDIQIAINLETYFLNFLKTRTDIKFMLPTKSSLTVQKINRLKAMYNFSAYGTTPIAQYWASQ